jgi:hypothetical protein
MTLVSKVAADSALLPWLVQCFEHVPGHIGTAVRSTLDALANGAFTHPIEFDRAVALVATAVECGYDAGVALTPERLSDHTTQPEHLQAVFNADPAVYDWMKHHFADVCSHGDEVIHAYGTTRSALKPAHTDTWKPCATFTTTRTCWAQNQTRGGRINLRTPRSMQSTGAC